MLEDGREDQQYSESEDHIRYAVTPRRRATGSPHLHAIHRVPTLLPQRNPRTALTVAHGCPSWGHLCGYCIPFLSCSITPRKKFAVFLGTPEKYCDVLERPRSEGVKVTLTSYEPGTLAEPSERLGGRLCVADPPVKVLGEGPYDCDGMGQVRGEGSNLIGASVGFGSGK